MKVIPITLRADQRRFEARLERRFTEAFFGTPPPPTVLDMRPRVWTIFDGISLA